MTQIVNDDGKRVRIGISGSTLKFIAIVTMLIDHIGATVIWRMVLDDATQMGMVGMVPRSGLLTMYRIMRYIGRIAFPIYCFLLVEGFEKTHSRVKYALRLGSFALISEIPFDLAFQSKVMDFSYQNVFFTLFIGLITMMAVDRVEEIFRNAEADSTNRVWDVMRYPTVFLISAAGAILAEFLHTDYGATGVLCIMVLYFFRRNKAVQMVAGGFAFLWEITAPLAFFPIAFYNGNRGLKLKYVFYLFYPLHLLILYLICMGMGISGYPTV